MPSLSANPPVWVLCLCADWCGTCRDYRALFHSVQADFAGQADFVWVDIEELAELMGGVDVEDFPTLLIAKGEGPDVEVRFWGPVLPHRQTLHQLIQHGLTASLLSHVDNNVVDLAQRLTQRQV